MHYAIKSNNKCRIAKFTVIYQPFKQASLTKGMVTLLLLYDLISKTNLAHPSFLLFRPTAFLKLAKVRALFIFTLENLTIISFIQVIREDIWQACFADPVSKLPVTLLALYDGPFVVYEIFLFFVFHPQRQTQIFNTKGTWNKDSLELTTFTMYLVAIGIVLDAHVAWALWTFEDIIFNFTFFALVVSLLIGHENMAEERDNSFALGTAYDAVIRYLLNQELTIRAVVFSCVFLFEWNILFFEHLQDYYKLNIFNKCSIT